jgi:O-antigen/teichoic acid export membrane protein
MMVSQLSIQLLGFATAIVVAHFLTPRQVGLVAMALVFSNLSLVIAEGGIGAALIQKAELSEEDKSTAFWTSAALGVVVTIAGVGLSWPVAALYGEPRVQALFAAMSPAFLFVALGIVQGALLTRELKFRSLELRTVAATFASALITMLLAALGLGPWALVGQILTISSVSTVLLWRSSDWRPRSGFSGASLREIATFSSHIFGTRLIDEHRHDGPDPRCPCRPRAPGHSTGRKVGDRPRIRDTRLHPAAPVAGTGGYSGSQSLPAPG